MKEAAGEANMTVITIIQIGIIAAIAYPMITNIMEQQDERTQCINNGGVWDGGACTGTGA